MAWEHLFRVGLELTKVTSENLAPPVTSEVLPEAGPDQIKLFKERLQHLRPLGRRACDIWYSLRHRVAHSAQPYKQQEWHDAQKAVANVLGKTAPAKPPKPTEPDRAPDLFAGDHLRLSGLEAGEAKLLLLRDYTDGLLALASDGK
jgi:hypothetical protein